METTEIQQAIRTHRRQLLVAIGVILLLAVVTILVLSNRADNASLQQATAMQDSLKAHEKVYKEQIAMIQQSHDSDVVRIGVLEEELDNTQAQLTIISNRYDKIRNNITHSSTDDKLRFLSGKLPQSSGSR